MGLSPVSVVALPGPQNRTSSSSRSRAAAGLERRRMAPSSGSSWSHAASNWGEGRWLVLGLLLLPQSKLQQHP